MPKFEVVHPVEHDHKRTESGFIELSAEAAEPLLAVGSIRLPVKARKAAEPTEPTGSAEPTGTAGEGA